MNKIVYSNWTFTDADIISGSVAMSNAMMFDSLNPDELTVDVLCKDTGKKKLLVQATAPPSGTTEWFHTVDNRGYIVSSGDIRDFHYGDPVLYYYNDVLQGRYYVRSVDRLSIDHFRINAFSVVGLWTGIQHMGGVYSGVNAGVLIADLLQGYTYSIDSEVGAVSLYGYLPIASVRDNLQQVLFAIGASMMKGDDGNPLFRFIYRANAKTIADNRIFIGGKVNYLPPATSVRITEHSYYASIYDIEVSLFDNTDGSGAADNKLVTFDEPCYDLKWDGGALPSGWANGANYCYVTGTGVLTGKKYTHTTKIFSVPTEASGEPNEAVIDKATLVSAVNSINIASRVSAFKGQSEEVACGVVLSGDDLKPTNTVRFTDPYGEATSGTMSSMNITMSGSSKADCTVVKNYHLTKGQFGNNFTKYKLITSDQTWTPPTGTTAIRIILGQGGQAGQNGYNGSNSTSTTFLTESATAGAGGSGGVAGEAGKIFVTDIDSPTAITFSIGAAGTIGSGEGAAGNAGGHTTATMGGTTYTSADGAVTSEGYSNIFTGVIYGLSGIDGVQGGNGGGQNKTKGNGEDVTYNGTTWKGGKYSTVDVDTSTSHRDRYAYGGSGGGAAYGANGGNGGDATSPWDGGGDGGNGANASVMAYTPTYSSGGAGGCGGGGGGVAGYRYYGYNDDEYDPRTGWGGSTGYGGSFSNGTNGGKGFALIYY